jgi:predicted histone-like DNA-binding protein
MSILYKVIAMINPRQPLAPAKFFARAIRKERLNIKQISKIISGKTSLDHVDTQAVVLALVDVVINELQEGRSVQLGDLGTFSLSVSSEGAETADKFTPSAIKKVRINYRPGSELTGVLKNLKFEKQG